MNFLERLQNLPVQKKKIILWASISILAIFLFNWYLKTAKMTIQTKNSKKLFEEELKIPQLGEEIKKVLEKIKPEKGELEEIKENLKGLIEEAEKESSETKNYSPENPPSQKQNEK